MRPIQHLFYAALVLAVVLGAMFITSCSPTPTPTTDGTKGPVMQCPYGREFARMSDKDQDWYLTQKCELSCPSTAGKSGRRFARNLPFDRVVRLKELGCPLSDRLQWRLNAGK